MAKIYVKLKDTSGGYLIVSQGLSVNRKEVKQVEEDDFVRQAIRGGALIKATESEFTASKKNSAKTAAKMEAKKQEKYAKAVGKQQEKLDALKAKAGITEDAGGDDNPAKTDRAALIAKAKELGYDGALNAKNSVFEDFIKAKESESGGENGGDGTEEKKDNPGGDAGGGNAEEVS